MGDLKLKIFSFLDSLKLKTRDFDTLGLIITIFAALKLFLVGYMLYILIFLGSKLMQLIYMGGLGLGSNLGGNLITLGFSVIFILLGALYVLELKCGLEARKHYNSISSKEHLKKWLTIYIIVVIISIVMSLFNIKFSTIIMVLINIFSVILYSYFVERLGELDVNNYENLLKNELENEEKYIEVTKLDNLEESLENEVIEENLEDESPKIEE